MVLTGRARDFQSKMYMFGAALFWSELRFALESLISSLVICMKLVRRSLFPEGVGIIVIDFQLALL
eukprot:3962247-Ditylum_brightwellii.AAC.1